MGILDNYICKGLQTKSVTKNEWAFMSLHNKRQTITRQRQLYICNNN
jgi:hypothetical protein